MIREGLRIVWRYLVEGRQQLLVLSILAVISALANGTVPYIAGRLFDAINTIAKGNPVPTVTVKLLGIWFVVQLIANIVDWQGDLRREKFGTSFRIGYLATGFQTLLRLPLRFHKEYRPGAIFSKLSNAAQSLTQIMERVIIRLTPETLSVIVGFVIVFWLHAGLALVLLFGVVLYSIVIFGQMLRVMPLEEEAQEIRNEYFAYANDLLINIFPIKYASAEVYESKQIDAKLRDRGFKVWYRMERAYMNTYFFSRLTRLITQTAIFLYSIILVGQGSITIGTLVAFNGYAAMVFGPFTTFAEWMRNIQEGLVSAVKANKILSLEPEPYHGKAKKKLSVVSGEVRFDSVSFAYDTTGEVVLRAVSFEVKPGEVVALVGQSGVGKSTLVDLISGYYFATSGDVAIDGNNVLNLDLETLRKHIAIVPQEISLFNATLRENIVYGAFDATETQISRAVEEAELTEFIEKLPKKYDTVVGNRGIKLSVGQKQRVAIARAILRDPKILILDEPTSALDSQTERSITEALERLMQGRTTFIVAHRLSTVRKADRILVLEKGSIVEQGSHDTLMAIENGVYRKLYEMHIGLQ